MKVLITIVTILIIGEYVSQSANSRSHPNWPHEMDTICGENTPPLLRIVNGLDADLGEYPWIARIHVREENQPAAYLCGGSLITDRHVVTAAHCVTSDVFEIAVDGVLLGEWDTLEDSDCQFGVCAPLPQYRKPKRIAYPESYSTEEFTSDIAIITLDEPIELNEYVVPICLPDEDQILNERDRVTVAGWGLLRSPTHLLVNQAERDTFAEENSPNKLQWLGLLVLPMTECDAIFLNDVVLDNSRQICGGNRSNADSCSGDSGGPLMSQFRDEERGQLTYLTGIVSFGAKICGRNPAIYTRVTAYLKFILDNLIE